MFIRLLMLFGVEEDLEKKILISKIIVLENLKEDM